MSLFFWIVVSAALGALALGLILKVRLRKQQVWEELAEASYVPSPTVTNTAQDSNSIDSTRRSTRELEEIEKSQDLEGDQMKMPPLSPSQRSVRDTDQRRSSRIERLVSLVVLGTNRRGEIFQERTSAVSVNLHGCRYSSRHEYAPEGWITLQVTGTDGANSRPVRARVRSVFSAENSRELCQVGVELETPGNVWGIATPPEDWQRILGANNSATRATAAAPAPVETSAAISTLLDRHANANERKAEVTVFPGPPAPPTPPAEEPVEKENPPTRAERVVITAEQLLHALQGKLQLAAEKAVQVALASQLDETVKTALGKIEDGWKANVRKSEEFSAARLADAKSLWETELHAYRDRAEDIARRIEALTALSQQALNDSQRFAERFTRETAPQLHARLGDSFNRAHSEFEARAAEVTGRHLAQLNENAQRTVTEARSKLDENVAQASSLVAASKTPPVESVTQEQLENRLEILRAENLASLDKRLSEIYAGFERQIDIARSRTNDMARELEGLALESRQARSQHEQGLAEIRSLLANAAPGLSPEQLHSHLHSSQEKILSHLEWRLGEVSGHYDQLLGQLHNRANEISQKLEQLAGETHDRLAQALTLAERAPRELTSQDLAAIDQSVAHATTEFENTAARVSDRQLVRLMEQKQAVTQEATLELDARATEARALLQKVSNTTLDEFRRRVESQIDQVLAEAKERAVSSFSSLDAESRAAVEARRRTLEADVARAAEQSTAEFRSGIKAFLYSCLVAAVSAVDQHAQTTLAGLSTDPANVQRALEASSTPAAAPTDTTQFPPKAASTS